VQPPPNLPLFSLRSTGGMRDIIVHRYFDIDAEIVFDVVKNKLPDLKHTVSLMIADLQEQESKFN